MSSFFTVPGAQKKRKRATAPDVPPQKRIATNTKSTGRAKPAPFAKKSTARQKEDDRKGKAKATATATAAARPRALSRNRKAGESVSGSESDEDDAADDSSDLGSFDDDDAAGDGDDDSELDDVAGGDEAETAAERRLRLAERYLENVRREVGGAAAGERDTAGDIYAFDAEEIDRDLIAERLQEDVAESKGRVYRQLADELAFAQASHCLVRWNAHNVNAVAVCAPYAYTVSSDTCLTKWRIQDRPADQLQQRAAARQKYEAERPRNKKHKAKKNKKNTGPAAETAADAADAAAAAALEVAAAIPPRTQPQRLLFRRGNPARRRDKSYRGHVGAILTVAASQDGRFVVTGGADRRMVVWDAATLRPLRVFTHHRDAVTGLAFRRGTNQLYSCSKDRTIKVWSLDELAYVQTLFGHQDHVGDIDALAQEKCLSVGTRDRTARLWKVIEETQLVFRGGGGSGGGGGKDNKAKAAGADPYSLAHEGSMDRVAMLDDELFVTGSDNGALALWSTQKKKPLFVVPRAHGLEPVLAGREAYDQALATADGQAANPPPPPQPRWITALRTIPYADVVLSGSWDGCVRVWRLSKDKRKLEAVGTLGVPFSSSPSRSSSSSFSVPGVINDIAAFERGERGRDGLSVVVAVGQEHRLGRWGRVNHARNGAVVFEIYKAGGLATGVNGVNGVPNGVPNGGLNGGLNGVKDINGFATNGVAQNEASKETH